MSELFSLTDAFACFISVDNVQGKCRSAVSFFFWLLITIQTLLMK